MNSALVNITTNIVENIIVAEPVTPCPFDGYIMVGLADGQACDIGWIYNPADGTFSNPTGV
jgi:hypothetical protein